MAHPLRTVLLVACALAVADASDSKPPPAWLDFMSNAKVMRGLQCSVCLATMADVLAHISALWEMRGADESEGQVSAFVQGLCKEGEEQFWALKWTPSGPAEYKYKKRYDIEKDEADVAARLAEAGFDPTLWNGVNAYWGTPSQKDWASRYYIRTCEAALRDMDVLQWYKHKTQPVYPTHCPFEACKDDPVLYAH